MLILASFASQLPASVGAIAAAMAIGGFLPQVRPAIRGASEQELRRSAAIGGIVGPLSRNSWRLYVCYAFAMSRRELKQYGALLVAGTIAMAVVIVGLGWLGAPDELTATMVVAAFAFTFLVGGFLIDESPIDRR